MQKTDSQATDRRERSDRQRRERSDRQERERSDRQERRSDRQVEMYDKIDR